MRLMLVLCSKNTCRSPMAEGILRMIANKKGITDIVVRSMGLSPLEDQHPSDYAIEVLQEIGIDIRNHTAHQVLKSDLEEADKIYVMTEQHKNVIVDSLPEFENKIVVMDIPDTFGKPIERYRECRDKMIKFFEDEL